eukprot:scaffold87724_cov22-Cyclotella_meneghiniana.AAC.5
MKKKISEYFDIAGEGPKYQISFKGSQMTDSLQCLRVRQRPYYVQTAPTNRLIDFGDLEDEFGNMRSD